ncbi:hypothetical protein EW146_g5782 [Bondarzewia mesenterica]|uniref:SAP domain-containing protein n=1 Tax=Bondarzewia mesenterica TaxID=1095465 RepID=A0A4S4LQH7_9AGAM|nr:hypothetical protein EW146_g5782 [Bondarzewia mesenterica]
MNAMTFSRLPYAQIQRLAMKNNIKANGKKKDMIDKLLEIHPTGVPRSPSPTASETMRPKPLRGQKRKAAPAPLLRKSKRRAVAAAARDDVDELEVKDEPMKYDGVEKSVDAETHSHLAPPRTAAPTSWSNREAAEAAEAKIESRSLSAIPGEEIDKVQTRVLSQHPVDGLSEQAIKVEPEDVRLEFQPTGISQRTACFVMQRLTEMVNEDRIKQGVDDLQKMVRGMQSGMYDAHKKITSVVWTRIGLEEELLEE